MAVSEDLTHAWIGGHERSACEPTAGIQRSPGQDIDGGEVVGTALLILKLREELRATIRIQCRVV